MKNINGNKRELAPKQREELLRVLKARFEKNMNRHKGLECAKVQAKLEAHTEKLWSLNEMERTGGEPDVVGHDKKTREYIYCNYSGHSNLVMISDRRPSNRNWSASVGWIPCFLHVER